MKALFIAYLAFTSCALAQINDFFSTESVSTNFEIFKTYANQGTNSRFLDESLPADADPAGNWGEKIGGAQLSIRLGKRIFTNGEPIHCVVLLRNVSDSPLQFLFFYPKDHALRFLLHKEIKNETGTNIVTNEMVSEITSRDLTGKLWRPVVQVGKQYESVISLSDIFNLDPGKYRIEARRSVMIQNNPTITNVDSGFASFEIVGTNLNAF